VRKDALDQRVCSLTLALTPLKIASSVTSSTFEYSSPVQQSGFKGEGAPLTLRSSFSFFKMVEAFGFCLFSKVGRAAGVADVMDSAVRSGGVE
jgi:hypothetical protein